MNKVNTVNTTNTTNTTHKTVNDLIQNTKNKIKNVGTNLKDGGNELIVGNYVLIMALLISFLLFVIVYFTSKSFRVGRTVSTLRIYQSFQELQNFPYSRYGNTKLCDVKVASSYNAASNIYQMIDYTAKELVLIRLQSGVKYLEFNIFNSEFGQNAEPVISNGYKQGEWKMTLNTTHCADIFKTIADNAFKLIEKDAGGVPNPQDPIFIGLNLNTNNNIACLNKLAGYIYKHFKDRLLPNEFSFQSNEDLPSTPLHELMERVVIFASDGFQGSHLEELVNYSWDNIEDSKNHKLRRYHYEEIDAYLFNSKELTEFNKSGLTIVVPNKEGDYISHNYNANKYLDLGCQFVTMNYQTIDSKMDSYITEFKDSSIILKPKKLRK
jgi:hypothetical protein